MRIQVWLLLLAVLNGIHSAWAIVRGGRRFPPFTVRGRHLKGAMKEELGKEKLNGEDHQAKKHKAHKKKCKKAPNHIGLKKHKQKGDDLPTIQGGNSGGHRILKGDDLNTPDTIESMYCLHGNLTNEQCEDLNNIYIDNNSSTSTELSFELVHPSNNKTTEDILSDLQDILDTDATKRYVGCKAMAKCPPKAKKSEGGELLRALAEEEEEEEDNAEEEEGLFRDDDEEESIYVTGIVFSNVEVIHDGCATSSSNIANEGYICDLFQSDVTIYYEGGDSYPTYEEVGDMKNLLVETILSQLCDGTFDNLGQVENIKIVITDDDDDFDGSSSSSSNNQLLGNTGGGGGGHEDENDDNGGSNTKEDNGYLKYILIGASALAVFGVAYILCPWNYCCCWVRKSN